MDQVKIGLFIQQMRKDAGMTQKETDLAIDVTPFDIIKRL